MKWFALAWLWLLIFLLPALAWVWYDRLRGHALSFSSSRLVQGVGHRWQGWLGLLPLVLRMLVMTALFVALLRPQALMGENEIKMRGINIVLLTDLSGSMIAEDLKPDRLTAEKEVLQRFVSRIKYDQVGLVVFGAQAFTQAPLTMDYEVLRNAIKETDLNTVDADGTAIGDGILTAVNRLAEYDGETNIVILATDGTNNKGNDPLAAAEIAAAKRVRIYIVGIGAQGGAPILVKDQFGVKQPYVVNGEPQRWEEPNDAILTQIAAKTGGEYFRATDEKALDRIYARIAELIKDEKKRREQQYKELFHYFLLAACLGLLLEMLIRQVWIREIA